MNLKNRKKKIFCCFFQFLLNCEIAQKKYLTIYLAVNYLFNTFVPKFDFLPTRTYVGADPRVCPAELGDLA